MHLGHQGQLPQTRRRLPQEAQEGHRRRDVVQLLLHRVAAHRLQTLAQQLLINRRHLVAQDVFNHLIALIHRVLHEVLAGHRTNEVESRHIRLILQRDLRQCRGRVGGERHPTAFQKPARHLCPDFDKDMIRFDDRIASWEAQGHRALFNELDLGTRIERHLLALTFLLDLLAQRFVHAIELFFAIDKRHPITLGDQRQRHLRRTIARPHYQNILIAIRLWIAQPELHMRQVIPSRIQLSRVAQFADRDHHMPGRIGVTHLGFHLKHTVGLRNRLHRDPGEDLELIPIPILLPRLENRLPAPLTELDIASQWQLEGQSHDVFAVLILQHEGIGHLTLFEHELH